MDAGTVKPFSSGQYTWTVPGALNDLNNTNIIKITQQGPANETDTKVVSLSNFSILGALAVIEPENTDEWGVNTTQTIKFTKKGALKRVNFYYAATGSAPGGAELNGGTPVALSGLTQSPAGTYHWDWGIPLNTTLTVGKAGKIRVAAVSPAAQSTVEGISAGFQVKGSITNVKLKDDVTTMVVGDPIFIQWTPGGGIVLFKIYYN